MAGVAGQGIIHEERRLSGRSQGGGDGDDGDAFVVVHDARCIRGHARRYLAGVWT